MAKGQQRSNKEMKKPKKDKAGAVPDKSFITMPKTVVPTKQK
jgi:hypothetical protein